MAKKINLKPQFLDLILYAGDGLSFNVTVADPDGELINLTGDIRAQARATRHAPDPPDAEFDIDTTNSVDGTINLKLTGEQTEALYALKEENTKSYVGVWDLQWIPEGAEPVTLCQGKLECLPDVTH